jgi:hypothetical protein
MESIQHNEPIVQQNESLVPTQPIETYLNTVQHLYDKYVDNPYMAPKFQHFICNQLETMMDQIDKTHNERVQRIEDLTSEQYLFIESFMFHNKYFYHPTTEAYFYYDGHNYVELSEDEVLYNVLTTISRDRSIMSWKHKTKVSIMKRIKDIHIYQTIPESATIQNVLNALWPAVFKTKAEAKYFLTVIGDNILSSRVREPKDPATIHIVSSALKPLLHKINVLCQTVFGANPCSSFKHKYHAEHNYALIRLLSNTSTRTIGPECTQSGSLDNIATLNLLCVACHYSSKYQSSEQYLLKYCNDDEVINSITYLKSMTPETLIELFIGEYIFITPTALKLSAGLSLVNNVQIKPTTITWKNMQYLWKHFLDSKCIPNVVFASKLKTHVIEKLAKYYVQEEDVFNGIYSKHLPSVCKFLQFWDETMVVDDDEYELETSEVATLFKVWLEGRNESKINMNDKQVMDIINFFYPEIDTEGDKFIYKVKNTLWDKQMEIHMSTHNQENISSFDAYVNYCAWKRRQNKNLPVASKQYFDKLKAYEPTQ